LDPWLWERVDSDDIKYALKVAWKEYRESWEGGLFAAFKRKTEPAAPAAQAAGAGTQAADGSAATAANSAATATGDPSTAADSRISGAEVRDFLVGAAQKARGTASDPAARQRLLQALQVYGATAKGLADDFLAGYRTGKDEALRIAILHERKRIEELQERRAKGLPVDQEGDDPLASVMAVVDRLRDIAKTDSKPVEGAGSESRPGGKDAAPQPPDSRSDGDKDAAKPR
jgi:hypothetical protein